MLVSYSDPPQSSDAMDVEGGNKAFLTLYLNNEKSDVNLQACLSKALVYALAKAGTNHIPVMPENPLGLTEVTPTFEDRS